MPAVFITGIGIVSALGIGVQAQRQALVTGRSGLKTATLLNSIHKKEFPFGEVKFTTTQLMERVRQQQYLQFSRLQALAALAIEECLLHRADSITALKKGFINATTVGGMTDIEDHYFQLIDPDHKVAEEVWVSGLDCGVATEDLAKQYDFTDYLTTISTACSSSANAIQHGARLVEQGFLDMALCGGVDSLTRFTVNGFSSLKNLDRNPCKPFDSNRNGLNLGEGAAYLLLESQESLKKTGNKPLAVLSGYSNFNEAFHPTAPSPEGAGAYEAMKNALTLANLGPEAISHINVHGTATLNNDESEGRALRRLFGDAVPDFISTKPYTGHTLAAAGAIEAVFAILSLQFQEIYASLNFDTPMPELDLIPVMQYKPNLLLNHIMSNSFGFGGNNASLILSRYD